MSNPFEVNDPKVAGDNPFAVNDPIPVAPGPVPVAKKNYTLGEAIGAAPGNSYQSGVNFAKGVRDTVLHPVDSAKNLGKMTAGAVINLHPEQVKKMILEADPRLNDFVQTANAVGGVYKDRYGSRQAIINTFAEDPIGFAADLSTVLSGGAGAARATTAVTGRAGNAVARGLGAAAEATNPMAFNGLAASVVSRPAAAASKVASLTKQQTAANALAAVSKYSNPATYANKIGEGMRHLATGPKANLVLNEAEDPIAVLAQLKQNQQIVPGSQPNPAQAASAAGSTRWSAMGKAVDQRMSTETDRLHATQSQAQLDHLRHIGHTPEIYDAHGRARAAQSKRDYGASDPVMSTIDRSLINIIDRDHIRDVVDTAKKLASAKGYTFSTGNQLSGRDIHFMKLAFDDMAKKDVAATGGAKSAVHDAIVAARGDFLKWVAQPSKNPLYDVGRKNYAANSRVMDRMLFGQHLQQILVKPLSETYTAEMRANQFAQALRDPVNGVIKNHAVKRATGNEYAIRADELMTPDEMKALERIRDDLGRAEYVKGLAGKAASQHGNNLNTAASDWLLPNLIHQQGKASFLTRTLDERIAKQVSNAFQTQKGAEELLTNAMRRKGAVDSAAKNINRAGKAVTMAPGMYNALRHFNEYEYQPQALGNEPVEQDWSGRASANPSEQSNNAFTNRKGPSPNRKPTKKQQTKKHYTEKPMP